MDKIYRYGIIQKVPANSKTNGGLMGRIQEDGTEFVGASRDARRIIYIIEDWKLDFEIRFTKSSYKAKLVRAEKLETRVPSFLGDVPPAIQRKGRMKALKYYAAYQHRMQSLAKLEEREEVQLKLAL